MKERVKSLVKKFEARFGKSDEKLSVFFAPGRVNLIGEHTDYNGGYVLPFALQYGTLLLIRFNGLDQLRLSSVNFPYEGRIPVAESSKKIDQEWANYPLGVIQQFRPHLNGLKGMDMLYEGDIPNGAGLSSSASIEMVTACAINELYRLGWPMIELIRASKKAENEFVGVNCGIMDQYAVGNGKKDHAIFLDCDAVRHEWIPLELKDYRLIIANTNKKRKLSDSKYNERVEECAKAVSILKRFLDVRQLGQVSMADFETYQHKIPDETIRKRARHVISENDRVLRAVASMRRGDLAELGRLMDQSHESLRYDYEVTGHELDSLVEAARRVPGVLGSRMTGAGFGGCTVSILQKDQVETFRKQVHNHYMNKTGLIPSFYEGEVSNGVTSLQIP
ncbi:MAG: galactokinase [Bacteroidales bacterium]|nr:galactokinase [Bacteroidales bacterium]